VAGGVLIPQLANPAGPAASTPFLSVHAEKPITESIKTLIREDTHLQKFV